MIDFACPYCDKVSSVPDSFAGRKGQCPGCGNVIEVPDPNEAGPEDYADAAPPPPPAGPQAQAGQAFGTPVGGGADDHKPCPFCGEPIKRVAKKCKFCGEYLDRRLRHGGAEARERARRADEMPSAAEYVFCVLCGGIACIVAIVYLIQGYTKKGGIMLAIVFAMQIVFAVIRVLADLR